MFCLISDQLYRPLLSVFHKNDKYSKHQVKTRFIVWTLVDTDILDEYVKIFPRKVKDRECSQMLYDVMCYYSTCAGVSGDS